MSEEYTPIVEDLLERVSKLEEVVRTLIGHQHYVNRFGYLTTRPAGMNGTKVGL